MNLSNLLILTPPLTLLGVFIYQLVSYHRFQAHCRRLNRQNQLHKRAVIQQDHYARVIARQQQPFNSDYYYS